MKTFIPSEEELVELGFERRIDGTWVRTGTPNMYYYIDEKKFFATGFEIYPRSKEHLESIILAFKKPQ